MNPILQKLQPQNYNNLKTMVNMVRNSGNPQATMMNMMRQNPRYNEVMNIVNQYGDPKTAFYAEAKRRGVDPNTILRMLK